MRVGGSSFKICSIKKTRFSVGFLYLKQNGLHSSKILSMNYHEMYGNIEKKSKSNVADGRRCDFSFRHAIIFVIHEFVDKKYFRWCHIREH